jgi:hypothetical protein
VAYAKLSGGRISSDLDGFHSWVQTDAHAIDFMARRFREGLQGRGTPMWCHAS